MSSSKVHLAGAATMVHFSGGLEAAAEVAAAAAAVTVAGEESDAEKGVAILSPREDRSGEANIDSSSGRYSRRVGRFGSPKRRLAGVGNLHSSPEKKEHRSSGSPAEHCADFSGTPSLRQRHVIVTSAAQ
ncbi:hypothetical protein ACLOJK_031756 [Asimina triloba]